MSDFNRHGGNRRDFLKLVIGAGAAGAAASLFPWLKARADGEAGAPKLLLYYTPHGTIWDQWRPSGGETGFDFSYILEPLRRHQDQLVIVDGLGIHDPYDHRVPHTYDLPAVFTGSPIDTESDEYRRDDHGVTFGWNTGVSIDQTIANRLAPSTPHRTIEFGVRCAGSHPSNRMIYTAPGAPKHPLDDPGRAWDQIFAGSSGATDARRRAILDTVREDLARVRPTLSSANRARLDAHATSLQELQASLGGGPSMCMSPSRPGGGGLDVTIDQQAALITTALACGHTRIASMQIRIGDNDGSLYPWVGLNTGGHHMLSHDSSSSASSTRADLYRWYSERFAHLLDLMAAIPDGEGTSLLDNTMILWGSEIGVGWNHDIQNVPFIVAGGRARGVRGGRYLRPTGMYHNRLLVSAAHYMGLGDISSYGSTDTRSGPLPGLLSL